MKPDIEPEEKEVSEPQEESTETYQYEEIINMGYTVLCATDDLDLKMMPNGMEDHVRQARNKAVQLILYAIDKVHEEVFDEVDYLGRPKKKKPKQKPDSQQ